VSNFVSQSAPDSPAAFAADDARELRDNGWALVRLPAGLTLAGLRAAGAPFKGGRYFSAHAPHTAERTTVATDLAYKPALLPGAFNRTFADTVALVDGMAPHLPAGVAPVIAPAAAYVWLLAQHHAATGDYPFRQLYTWAVDRYQDRANLVVGVFGQRDPLIVAPQVEGHGGGVGVWPLLVPRAVVPELWPAVAGR
jgi:hypothetical protein